VEIASQKDLWACDDLSHLRPQERHVWHISSFFFCLL